jgi:signal peptidase I
MKYSSNFIQSLRVLLILILMLSVVKISIPKNDYFVVVKGGSMEPTFVNNQLVLVDTDVSKLFLGDIVIAEVNGEKVIKRITGLPGDFYVENLTDEHSYVLIPKEFYSKTKINPKIKIVFKTIPPDFYFLEGDNPDKSIDSKVFGLVHKTDILGKCMVN